MQKKSFAVAAAVILILQSCSTRPADTEIVLDRNLLTLTGTFSSLRVTKQGVFGMEVRIAVTNDPPYEAIVQFGAAELCEKAEWESEKCFGVSNLNLVAATLGESHEGDITFGISDGPYAGTFHGTITDRSLDGEYAFRSGQVLRVSLIRGASYWDSASAPR